jgi:hypothetical protein
MRISRPAPQPARPAPMPTIRVPNPAPRSSPAGISGSANVDRNGWNANVRGTVGNANRNAFIEVGAGGAHGGPVSGSIMAGTSPTTMPRILPRLLPVCLP